MERQAAIQPEPARVPVPPPLPNQDWLKPAVPTPRQTRYVPQKQRKSPKSGAGFSLKTRAAQVFVLLSVVGAGFKVYNKVVGKPSNSPAGYVGSIGGRRLGAACLMRSPAAGCRLNHPGNCS